jgi:hypothetical protein
MKSKNKNGSSFEKKKDMDHDFDKETKEGWCHKLLKKAEEAFEDFINFIDSPFSDEKNKGIEYPVDYLEELTYDDAIRWFIRHKKDVAASKKGVLRKQQTEKLIVFQFVFLDAEDKLVKKDSGEFLCRIVHAPKMDDELSDMFEGQDFVTIE